MGQINGVVGSKLPKWTDRTRASGIKYDAATYMGVVKDNSDPIRGGRLRVWIPDFGGTEDQEDYWQTVSYASPFFGATFVGPATANNAFNTTNHTYGMWMVPPDLNNQVLCTFVNGDPDRGYWFACVNPTLSHHMVPGIAGAPQAEEDTSHVSATVKKSLLNDNSQTLPVVEFNENDNNAYTSAFYNNPKPIHETQASILFQQGLDRDPMRGAISSSSQRESPSSVFGISTPGRAHGASDPSNDPNYQAKLQSGTFKTTDYVVKTRNGGHSFVMDDGDAAGKDRLIRLRSSGGHTILMNDTEGVMFIINSTGTTWIELAKHGDMNIYNAGSFSVRSQKDINLHADRNININSKELNINADTVINAVSADINISASATALLYGGKTNIGAGGALTAAGSTVTVGSGGAITIAGGTVDINSGADAPEVSSKTLQKTDYPDTSYDSGTGLWNSVTGAASSIVGVFPTHQPWIRSATPGVDPNAIPSQTLPTTVCPPKPGTGPANTVLPPPNGNKLDYGTLRNFGKPNKGDAPWTTDTEFLDKVKSVAAALNADYIDVLAFMYNESAGTYDPGIVNSIGATGLIQFMPATATGLGTTTQALAQLSRVDQMDWVLKYFNYFRFTQKVPNPKLQDLYLCVFWPAAIGQADNYVIAPAGSQVASQNRGLCGPDGSITCASVGAVAAAKIPLVKQALANAGAVNPNGVVQSGSGVAVTDGSGNPVTTGTANTTGSSSGNVGITNATNKSITNQCPSDWLFKPELYKATGPISTSAPYLTQTYATNMLAELAYFESKWDYTLTSPNGILVGKYQVDANYLADAGYVKPDAVTQYGDSTLKQDESWTGTDNINSQADFIANKQIQDSLQNQEFNSNYSRLVSNQGIYQSDDICTAAGMLFVAHKYRSADLAAEWRRTGSVANPPAYTGVAGSAEEYYNHGRYAIDVLSAKNSAPATNQAVAKVNPTSIDPNSVLNFTSGTGSLESFQATSSTFQSAMLQAAKAFLDATGTKITVNSAYRSQESQTALYDRWVAAGGKIPEKPTAAGITTPSKSVGSHGGIAIDSSQSTLVAQTIDLAKFGLRWGGTFTTPDAVHIQLLAWAPGQAIPQ